MMIGSPNESAELSAGAQAFAPREAAVGLPAVLARPPGDDRHLGEAEQDARDQSGEEQRAERGAGHRRVQDHRRGRRDHRPDAGGGRGDRRREVGGIAGLLHRRDDDRAGAGEVRGRRADHAAEEHRGDDVDLREPGAHRPDQGVREVEQALGDAARVHQPAGEHEQRQGEQDEAAHAGDHHLRQGRGPGAGQPEVERDRGDQGHDHGHAQDQEPAEREQRDDGLDHAARLPPTALTLARATRARRRPRRRARPRPSRATGRR